MERFNVFYVNKGQLFAIEPQSPNLTIKSLQPQIKQFTGIRIDDQVLIVSGGEAIDSDRRLLDCQHFGTLNNPVFLFQRPSKHNTLEVNVEQEICELNHVVDEAFDQVAALNNADSKTIYMTLPDKARLCKDAGVKCVHNCARMVQEHHLLVKGWQALVNNVDDNIQRLKRKTNRHRTNIEKVRQQNEKATMILQDFEKCLQQLQQITIPGYLIAHSRGSKDPGSGTDTTLYDWISHFDPNFSLQALVDNVREQFQQYGESSGTEICAHFDGLATHAKKEPREIKGINVRFSQLDQNLGTADNYNKELSNKSQLIIQSPSLTDQYAIEERVNEQMAIMEEVQKLLRELKRTAGLFHKSKVELLGNLKQRLTGWTVQCYEMLHMCATEIMVFEEKFNGIKNRLEIVHQIKEAPILFVTAVCEVIRRTTLQKEFSVWHKQHVDRCASFARTEDETRSQIANKLQKHFLRVLFPGIFDKFPEFFVKSLEKYDQELPPVSADYIRQLREGVKELETFLKVTSPQVFEKLCVRDGSMSIISPGSQPAMRREESFFTQDSTMNIATMNKNFPSTTWLGGLEAFDNSPSIQPAIPLGTSPPPRVGVINSINIPNAPSLNQLSMLAEEDVPSSVLGKSAPIDIPIAIIPREVSEKSSKFSTPDDHFEQPDNENESSGELRDDTSSMQQFPVDDLNTRSQQSLEVLKSVLAEVAKVSKGLRDVRADVINRKDEFQKDFELLGNYTSDVASCRLQEAEKQFAAESKEKDDLIAQLREELEAKSAALSVAQEKLESKEKLEEEKKEELETTTKRLEELETEAKEFEKKVKEAEKEVYKRLTIEYELRDEKFRREYDQLLEDKEIQLRHMKKDIEKKSTEIEHLRSDPESENYRKHVATEIRQDLEKEFKSKIDLISKGLMQQREDAINRNKKEFEYELKATTNNYNLATKFLALERDRLKDLLTEKTENGAALSEEIGKDVKEKMEEAQKVEKGSLHFFVIAAGTQTDAPEELSDIQPGNLQFSTYGVSPPMVMGESQYPEMAQSTYQLQRAPSLDENKATHEVHRRDDKTVECAVQTRVHMKSMELMVSVQDIGEGSNVLVVWSDRHNAYMLFSSSTYLHFVKESSVRRLGLSMVEGSRRNWIFGRVQHLDLCMIRKPANRYNLPIDTRVYRVDVDTAPIEVKFGRDSDPGV